MTKTPISKQPAGPRTKKRQAPERSKQRSYVPALFLTADVTTAQEQQLAAAGFAVARFDGDSVRTALKTSGDKASGSVGIIWSGPERGIVAALLAGANPAPSLEEWHAEAEQVIGLFRRFRRRLVLINDASFTDPDAVAEREAIGKRFNFPALALPLLDDAIEADEASAMLQAGVAWLSRLAITHDPRLKGLNAELSASSIMPFRSADAAKVSVSQAFAALANWGEDQRTAQQPALEKCQAELAALKEERQLLREQIVLNIKELDVLQAAIRTERAAVKNLADKIDQQTPKLTSLINENVGLKEQLTTYTERAEAEAALAVQGFDQSGRFMDLRERVTLGAGVERLDGVIRLSAASAQSHAIYGPYIKLDPGEYEVCMALSMMPHGLGSPVAVVELVLNADGVLATRRFEGTKLIPQQFIMREIVTIPPQSSETDRPEFELRLWIDQIKRAEVALAYIRKLS